jgi:hypothetical protein
MGQDSSVSTATHYGLQAAGVKSRKGHDFLHPSRLGLGYTQPPVQWTLGLLLRGKAA